MDIRGFPEGELRVSDADRDRALAELREAFQAGRLTAEEFGQRAGQALGSRTGRELAALFADLPAPAARPVGPAPASRAMTGAGIAALCFSAIAVHNALYDAFAVHDAAPIPGFPWAAALTPAAIAMLLVMLITFSRARRQAP